MIEQREVLAGIGEAKAKYEMCENRDWSWDIIFKVGKEKR